jgi:hypothetical protein
MKILNKNEQKNIKGGSPIEPPDVIRCKRCYTCKLDRDGCLELCISLGCYL